MNFTTMRRVIAGALAAGAIAIAGTAITGPAAAQGEAIVKERIATMKKMGGNMKKLGQAVGSGNNAEAAEAANEIAAIAAKIPSLFPEGSGTGETNAKPEIWQDFTDFEAKAKATQMAAADIAAAAAAGTLSNDPKAVVGELGKNCGACHKAYRVPPKKD